MALTWFNRLARQAAERFEIPETTDIMYDRVPKDDQLRYYLDIAEQVRDTSDLQRFVVDDPDEAAIAQSLQTASQEIESVVYARLEEVLDATLVEIRREIPEMILDRTISDPHADKMRDEISAFREEVSKT